MIQVMILKLPHGRIIQKNYKVKFSINKNIKGWN